MSPPAACGWRPPNWRDWKIDFHALRGRRFRLKEKRGPAIRENRCRESLDTAR